MSLMLKIQDCGLINYSQCLDLQIELCQKRQAGQIDDTVLLAEHPPVITLGARQEKNLLLQGNDIFERQGIELIQIRRGGGATAHNPGQIVIYPIIDIKSRALGVSEYVRLLEKIGIDLLGKYSVMAARKHGLPGLWVDDEKIASIGVQVKKWVTFHGIAINICNDLSIFGKIVPCGLEGVKMTSVLEIAKQAVDMSIIKKELKQILIKSLG